MTTLFCWATPGELLLAADKAASEDDGGVVDNDFLKLCWANNQCVIASSGAAFYVNQILADLFGLRAWLPARNEWGVFNIQKVLRDRHPHTLDGKTPEELVEMLSSLCAQYRATSRLDDGHKKPAGFDADFIVGGMFGAAPTQTAGRRAVIVKGNEGRVEPWPVDVPFCNSPGLTAEALGASELCLFDGAKKMALGDRIGQIFAECAKGAPSKCSPRFSYALLSRSLEIVEPN